MLFVTGAMTDCTPIQKKVEEKFVETATFLAVILNYIKLYQIAKWDGNAVSFLHFLRDFIFIAVRQDMMTKPVEIWLMD